MTTISFVTTCKGRLEHIKETLPLIAEQGPDQVIVVDYGCPQKVGDWVEENLSSVSVIRVTDDPGFLLSRARNAGLAACKTDLVCFIDADVKIKPGFVNWLKSHCDRSSFYRAAPVNGELDKETWGTCIVPAAIVSKIGGYDEVFSGWGGEDDDLYHRLRYIGVTEKYYPSKFVEPIRHDEDVRMEQYKEKNKDMHHMINALYMEAKHQVMSVKKFAVHPEKAVRQKLMSQVKDAVDKWIASDWTELPSIKFKVGGKAWLPEPYVMEKTVSFELNVKKKAV
jgi:glycosyltransferase involved in cell wall biosynthesis